MFFLASSFSEQFQAFYYFNVRTEESQWIHPQDGIFKKKVQEARAVVADTSEEIDSGIRSADMEAEGGAVGARFGGKFLAPLVGRTAAPQQTVPGSGKSTVAELKPLSRVGQIRRQFDVQKVVEEEKDARKPPGGFTLTGTGSMFLKSNAKKSYPEDSQQPTEKQVTSVKGILRDSSLTDVRARMNLSEEEDKKSVRFTLFGQGVGDHFGTNSPAEGVPQRPSSALNKNLSQQSNSDDTTTDEEEEVIEELENDEDEEAWMPKPTCEIKVVTSAKIKPTLDEGAERLQSEMKSQFVDLQQEMKSKAFKDEMEENLRFEEEIQRVKLENARKMQRFIAEEEQVLQMKRDEMEINKQRSLTAFESELEAKLKTVRYEIEESYRVSLEAFRDELSQDYDEKRKVLVEGQKAAMEVLVKSHRDALKNLELEHANKVSKLKSEMSQEVENERQKLREAGEIDRGTEKMRCEKRLLEDKYRCLKDKYVRLKTDVKLSLEKRNSRRREQQQINNTSESNSTKTLDGGATTSERQPNRMAMDKRNLLEKKNSSGERYLKQQLGHHNDDTTTSISETTTVSHTYNKMNFSAPLVDENSDSEAFMCKEVNEQEQNRSRDRVKLFSRMKSASTSRLHSTKMDGELHGKPHKQTCTPVENLRRQLKKLEDLEDQFPENTLEATYHLRYPFTPDTVMNTSSELEFFKHRLHLERDSVRRAKDNLKNQRENFRARRELKARSASSTAAGRHKNAEQIMGEEKELTEMEVNLHRTRALLGEKVIRLRHLEQSLQRLFAKESKKCNVDNKTDATMSDLSSHSSSGFSSTDFMLSDNNHRKAGASESTTDILKNLEILNSEIREIWELLSKQTTVSSGVYYSSELDWSFNANSPNLPLTPNPLLTAASVGLNRNFTSLVSQSPVAGQYTLTLVERTRDLRNWLRQAKQEHMMAQKSSNI